MPGSQQLPVSPGLLNAYWKRCSSGRSAMEIAVAIATATATSARQVGRQSTILRRLSRFRCVCISFHWQPLFERQKQFKMPFLHDDLFVDMSAVKWQQSRLGQKTFTWPAAATPAEDGMRTDCVCFAWTWTAAWIQPGQPDTCRQTINPPGPLAQVLFFHRSELLLKLNLR